MYVKRDFKADYMHILFCSDVKEERYSYMHNNNEIGQIHVYLENGRMNIDLFEVNPMFRGKGWGTKMVASIFAEFPAVKQIWAMAEEAVLDGFWRKQDGFRFRGEGHDEQEGYLWFEINQPENHIKELIV